MKDLTLQDIQERFVYRDMAGIDGTDVTYLLNRIEALEAENSFHGTAARERKRYIAKLEAKLKRVNQCVRYLTTIEINGRLEKVPCLLLEHVQQALNTEALNND